MNKSTLLLFVFATCIVLQSAVAKEINNLSLIPAPNQSVINQGSFVFTPKTLVYLETDNAEMRNAVNILSERFTQSAGFPLRISSVKPASNAVFCKINPLIKGAESYHLLVSTHRIEITASSPAGIFYAMQSIRQLLPPEIEKDSVANKTKWAIPCLSIKDFPRYSYRGLMLDVCRHFMPVEFVKRYIDYLAYHKMNRFHWHLTDDQGWRIEIKKYPKLTSVGAFRDRTLIGHYSESPRKWKIERYGDYYTQEQIKEVVEYARKRFVTVIPEIEMPGHSLAALSAYPKLSCSGGPFEVVGLWGVFNDIYCTREETFRFLEDILSEVAELFPSQYIHIGGDEAPKIRWSRCHACQERIKSEGLKNEQELQSYFIRRIEKFLQTKGKRIIGWDEILEGGLAPNATVMSWRGTEGGIAAAKQRHDVIMTPGHSVYLDHYQSKLKEEPIAIGGYLPLQKVYEYNPTPASLTSEEANHILGVQGNVWTEYIHTPAHVEYMAFPRAAAIAEVAWSQQTSKDYTNFLKRLDIILLHFDAMGMNYSLSHKKTGP